MAGPARLARRLLVAEPGWIGDASAGTLLEATRPQAVGLYTETLIGMIAGFGRSCPACAAEMAARLNHPGFDHGPFPRCPQRAAQCDRDYLTVLEDALQQNGLVG